MTRMQHVLQVTRRGALGWAVPFPGARVASAAPSGAGGRRALQPAHGSGRLGAASRHLYDQRAAPPRGEDGASAPPGGEVVPWTDARLVRAAGAMTAAVAASNYLVLIPINDWFTAGTLSYPATFLLTDVTNRFLGPKTADRVVWAGFMAAMPVSYLLSGPRIAVASGTAYLTSQLLDVRIFHALRHRAWWVSPLVSTVVASALDSSLFVTIAFLGTYLHI